jgi:hypothetical protein
LPTQKEEKKSNPIVTPTQEAMQVDADLPTSTELAKPTNVLPFAPSQEEEHLDKRMIAPPAEVGSPTLLAHTDNKGSTSHGEDLVPKDNDNSTNDVVMCGTMTAHSEDDHDDDWVPPSIVKEFSYPSDEEIVPNPKTPLSRAFLPNLGKVRGWFKSPNGQGDGDVPTSSTSASCLPISSQKDELDSLSHPYVSLESRLPQDPALLQRL